MINGKWVYAKREEDYVAIYEWFDTKEEAIKEGMTIYENESFIVAQLKLIDLPTPDVISFLEKLEEEYIYDVDADVDVTLFDNISEENKEWLQDQLDLLMRRFYDKEKITSTYFNFINIEYIQGEE